MTHSSRDYHAIAQALALAVTDRPRTLDEPGEEARLESLREVANAIGDYFGETNPRFNRERFLKSARCEIISSGEQIIESERQANSRGFTSQDLPTPEAFTREDWQLEVTRGDTQRGFTDWQFAKLEESAQGAQATEIAP